MFELADFYTICQRQVKNWLIFNKTVHDICIYLISLTARLKSWWYYCYRGLESVSPSHACLDDKGQKQLKITELHLLCRS